VDTGVDVEAAGMGIRFGAEWTLKIVCCHNQDMVKDSMAYGTVTNTLICFISKE
jgi:hypothetical protein